MSEKIENAAETTSILDELLVGTFPILLQEEADKLAKDVPKQTCGETFTTKGSVEIDFKGKLTMIMALAVIAGAYKNAKEKADRFCRLLSEKDCHTLKFVKYQSFDSDVKTKEGGGTAMVEFVIVWKCAKQ